MNNWQDFIAVAIVMFTAVIAIRHIWKNLQAKLNAGCGGCAGCHVASKCATGKRVKI